MMLVHGHAASAATIPFSQDFDSNGFAETEGSRVFQEFNSNSEQSFLTLQFKYMLLTDEAVSDRPNDLFRIRLETSEGQLTNTDHQETGAVGRPGETYGGTFTEYDFSSNAIDQPIEVPGGGAGQVEADLLLRDGGIGWQQGEFPGIQTNQGPLTVEFLVADSADTLGPTVLLIDEVVLEFPDGSTSGRLVNGGFEDNSGSFDGWSPTDDRGDVGVYQSLANADNGSPVISSQEGNSFAVLSTGAGDARPIPEPGAAALLGGSLAMLALRRRRR